MKKALLLIVFSLFGSVSQGSDSKFSDANKKTTQKKDATEENLEILDNILRLEKAGVFRPRMASKKFTKKRPAANKKTLEIVFMSDTHGRHDEVDVPNGDIFVFCGDMCPNNNDNHVVNFANFLKVLPHEYKIVIAGNHDPMFEDKNRRAFAEKQIKSAGAIYLNDSGVEIEGIKIWGSPIQPEFLNWAFNRARGEEINRHWKMIPAGTQLLITHGPPYGILDKNSQGMKVGCKDLFKRVKEVEPRVHAFGHIHEGYGKTRRGKTTFVNAANLNHEYQHTNPPIVIKWKK